ncbi:MAG: ABC transporter permease, partial [Thermaurantiacus tibetensis]
EKRVDWRQAPGPFAALLGPPLGWFLLFFAAPLAVVLAYSFGTNVGVADIAISGTFANYARALEPVYLAIFLKSFAIAGAATFVCLLLGFPVALAIAFAQPRVRTLLLVLVMLPFWTNLLIRTYALMTVLRDEGLVNGALGALGLPPLPLLYTNGAVILGLVYVHLPFTVLPIYASLDRLDRSLIEASLDLGASHLATVFRVVLPLARPGILAGLLLTFIPALGSYLTPDLMGGPDSQMIANVIERQFKRANDWPFGAALAFLLMYLTFLALAAQGLFRGRRAEP